MNGTYYTITEVFDFGPHNSKVILDNGKSMKGAVPSPEQFTVHVTRTSTEGEDFVWPNFMGDKPDDSMDGTRRVSNVYVSDKTGAPCEDGTCLTLELPCFIMEGIGSIIKFNGNFNVFVKVAYDVTQVSEIATDDGAISPQMFDVDGGNRVIYGEWLKEDRYEDPQIPLSYVYYEPEMDADEKIPLIIWLHGAGEGGQEPPIAAIGNKVVNLISPKVQKIFGGKTYLLAPQAPTMWMDDGSGEYTKDGSSKYTEVLDALIGAFVDAHPQIDRSRIYIGGCSNGVYMTMKQIIFNQSRYAAAYPVSAALADAFISDEDILKLKDLPIWFTHAKTDPVVVPDDFVVPTYERLAKVNPNAHFTYWDKVLDHTGTQKNADGTPFEYIGHWSWIPMLNDECVLDYDGNPVMTDGKETPILEWMAAQKKA